MLVLLIPIGGMYGLFTAYRGDLTVERVWQYIIDGNLLRVVENGLLTRTLDWTMKYSSWSNTFMLLLKFNNG